MLAVCDGEGAYDGLTAIMSLTDRYPIYEADGVIIDRALPPAPEFTEFAE